MTLEASLFKTKTALRQQPRLLTALCLVILLAGVGCQPGNLVAQTATAAASPPARTPAGSEPPESFATAAAAQPSVTPVQAASPTAGAEAPLQPTAALELQVFSHSSDAQLKTTQDGQTAVVQVFSRSGIGSADVKITSDNYPEQILLQLHLRGLEQLQFTYGTTTVQLSLQARNLTVPIESVTQAGSRAQPIKPDSPYWMSVRVVSTHPAIPLTEGYFEVAVPPDFLEGQVRHFSISWVDFYR